MDALFPKVLANHAEAKAVGQGVIDQSGEPGEGRVLMNRHPSLDGQLKGGEREGLLNEQNVILEIMNAILFKNLPDAPAVVVCIQSHNQKLAAWGWATCRSAKGFFHLIQGLEF
jgi:hypothetical protein